jgi:class 3 adenylate cyclase/tetratricopeptide (TPR) repeat protein
MACPSCAGLIPDGARFCPSCGAPVAVVPSGERRVVTVLFADLVGFTGLAERLDPEQVTRLVDSCFALLVADIASFGGHVDKVLGDAIVALFGAPVAHEDDAERAVRAGLRMQATLAAHVAALEGAPDIRMRIGIRTGEVLVGALAGSDYTAMGDVMNSASRLQAEAPPGGVLVGAETHALTRDAIRYEPMGALVLRGRSQPLETYLAVEAVARPGSRHRRTGVPLVGRERELALGRAAIDLALGTERAVLIAVEGESGVGKSRLLDELVEPLEARVDVLVLEGACVPYGESNAWWPLASAVMDHVGLDPSASADQVRQLIRERGHLLVGADADDAALGELGEAFAHLLGVPSRLDTLEPAVARDAVFLAVVAVLEAQLRKGPVVIGATDVQWADTVVLELLERLLAHLARRPLVVVTSARPGPELAWPPAGLRVTTLRLPLAPLSRAAAAELVGAVVGHEVDAGIADELFDRSGGNPLFLEELAGLVAGGGSVGELPDSLRGLVAARLDRLAPEQRRIIDNAAVMGSTGSVMSLIVFARELGQPWDPADLAALVEEGLLDLAGPRWRFRSHSVRDVAYQTLTKAVRAVRHAGVAAVAPLGRVTVDDLAHHAATAAELVDELGPVRGVPDDIRDRAVGLLLESGHRAFDQGSLQLVVRQTSRALELLHGELTDAGRQALVLRGGAHVEMRHVAAARADLDRVLVAAVEAGDRAVEAEARRWLGTLGQLEGDLPAARRELGHAVEILRELGLPSRLARALRARGFLELFGGSLRDAEWFFGEAEGIYRELGDARGLAWVDQHRAWASFISGDTEAAEARLNRAASTLAEVGDRNGVGWAFGLLAWVHFFNRRFDQADELAEAVLVEAAERGDEWAVGMMECLQAALRLWSGRLSDAVELAGHARDRFRRLGDRFGEVQAMVPLLRAQLATGRTAAALRGMEELVAQQTGYGATPYPLLAAAGVAMHAGDGGRALALVDEALGRMDVMEGGSDEPLVVRAVALAQLGRFGEAAEELAGLAEPTRSHPFARTAAALVAVLDGRPDDALADAAAVAEADGATYLDRCWAHVASGAALAALARTDEARRALAEAVDVAVDVGDVVACSLACRAYDAVLGEAHPHGLGDEAVLGPGWRQVVSALAELERAA